jgi:hypothetical protein
MVSIVLLLAVAGGAPAPEAPERAASYPDSVTPHVMVLKGKTLPYTARAGTITLYDDKNAATARVFYTAFTLDGADPLARPVTFMYKGSAYWRRLRNLSFKRYRVATSVTFSR